MFRNQLISRLSIGFRPSETRPTTDRGRRCVLREFVERITLPLCPFACDAQIDTIIDDGKIDHAFKALLVIIADFSGRHRFELIPGLAVTRLTTPAVALRP